MEVLIVDDQINVISGIFCGVNWGEIGIRNIHKALSGSEAREIITNNKIDIMLCDIEMPRESGLELYDWLCRQNYDVTCIFLTAHADFIYAQRAIKLKAFDYILQPAPYSEIEKALSQAVKHRKLANENRNLTLYGQMVYSEKQKIIAAVFGPIFTSRSYNPEQLSADAKSLGLSIDPDSSICLALIHSLNPAAENRSKRETLETVMDRYFRGLDMGVVLFAISDIEFGLILFSTERKGLLPEIFERQLILMENTLTVDFKTDYAFYWICADSIADLGSRSSELQSVRDSNIKKVSGVFHGGQSEAVNREHLYHPDMRMWRELIKEGHGEIMITESDRYLDRLSSDAAGAEDLKRFYKEFIQFISVLLADQDISLNDFFYDDSFLVDRQETYKSIVGMKKLIHSVYEKLDSYESLDREKDTITQIMEYVKDNISEDLRRDDIAEEVNLNPSYLSRLFKKRTGQSLKEFIISEKMEMAQKLIISTSLTISMIAMKVGYTNFSLFSQNYKKVMGRVPSEEIRFGASD